MRLPTSNPASTQRTGVLPQHFMATLGLVFWVCGGGAAGAAPPTGLVESTTGVSFPTQVTIENEGTSYDLSVTGLAIRRKLVFEVYCMAHYLESGPPGLQADVLRTILSDAKAKQITMEFARDLRADQIRDGLTESYTRAARADELRDTRPLLQRFLRAIYKDVSKHERFIVRWLPGGKLQGLYGSQVVVEVASPTFARVFWSIWFGDHPIVDRPALIRIRTLLQR